MPASASKVCSRKKFSFLFDLSIISGRILEISAIMIGPASSAAQSAHPRLPRDPQRQRFQGNVGEHLGRLKQFNYDLVEELHDSAKEPGANPIYAYVGSRNLGHNSFGLGDDFLRRYNFLHVKFLILLSF